MEEYFAFLPCVKECVIADGVVHVDAGRTENGHS